MASWSAAVAHTEAPPVEARRTRTRARRRRDPLRSGVVWIVAAAIVLAGLVALNVAVLQLNVRLDQLSRDRATLREQNAALASQSSTAKASPLIQSRAKTRLGLEPAKQATYVELGRR
jgi:cell division protein FtsB